MKFGQKIAELRKKNHLSQEALAEKMNVSRQAVSKWESDQSIPDIEKIVDLSELFGVTTNYLLKNGTPSFNPNAISKNENEEKEYPQLTDKQMNEYLLTSTKAAHLKSLALFLSGLGLVLFISIYAWYEPFHGPFFSSVAITLLFITWAIAAGCLIYGFLLTRDFRQIKRKQFTLTNEQLLQIKNKQKDFQHQNNKRIITAVILCILTVIPPSIAVAWRAPSFIKWESLALSLLLFSIAIYQFIFYKLQNLIYIILTQQQKLLSKKDRQLLTNITIIYWFIILVYWFIMETYLYALPWSSELNFTTIFFGFIIYLIFTWFFFQKRAQK